MPFLTIHISFTVMGFFFPSLSLECEEVFWPPHQCQLILSLGAYSGWPTLDLCMRTWAMLFHVHLAKVPFCVNIFHELRGQRKLEGCVTCHSWPTAFLLHDGVFPSLSLECEEVFWLPHQCQLILNLVHTLVNPFFIHVYLLGPTRSSSMYTYLGQPILHPCIIGPTRFSSIYYLLGPTRSSSIYYLLGPCSMYTWYNKFPSVLKEYV